jgi:hypothetical protein
VSISSPSENDDVGTLIKVEGTATDDHGVTLVLVRMGEGRWTIAKGTTEWSAMLVAPASLQPGHVTIEVKAWDDRLFSQVVGVNVSLVLEEPSQNDRPLVTIESPTEGAVGLMDATIEGRTDDDSEIVTTFIAFNGGPLESLTTERLWEKDLSNLGPGDHSVTVIASDGLLVSRAATVNFTLVDYEPLRVIISTPEEGTEVTNEVIASGVVLGGQTELVFVKIRVDGGEWTEIGRERSWQTLVSLEGMEYGEHLIEVRAEELLWASEVANVTVVLIPEEEDPQRPREPDSIFIWLILVVSIVFIIAVWRARQLRTT